MRLLKNPIAVSLICLLFISKVQGQTKNEESSNFYEIQNKAESHFNKLKSAISHDKNEFEAEGREFDGSYHKYKRWEWYWRDRVMPNGDFPDLEKQHQLFLQSPVGRSGRYKDVFFLSGKLP